MKKRVRVYYLLALITMLLCACSIPAAKPESGIYYCEELNISINFAIFEEFGMKCAVLHNSDGSCEDIGFYTDFGLGMFFCDLESNKEFFAGKFAWSKKDDVFVVEEREDGKLTGIEYSFYPVDSLESVCPYCKPE